jgi:hypothetical protein
MIEVAQVGRHMQQGPTETWLDFYIKMRKGLNTQDRNKLDEEFFGNKNNWKYRTSTNLIRAGEPSSFPDFNKPYFELTGDSNNIRSRLDPDGGEWNIIPDLFVAGRDARLMYNDPVTEKVKHSIADRLPLYLSKHDRDRLDKLNDPEWVAQNPRSADSARERIAWMAKFSANKDYGSHRLDDAVFDSNPEVMQHVKDLNFEEKWSRLPTAIRQVLSMRKDLYNDLKPEIKDIIHPPTPQKEPFKPQPVDWFQSRTKNLETTPEAQTALIQRIQQLQSGQISPDLQAGMINPSVAGDALQRSAVNDQNLAVARERMAARKESTPWLARLLAPETSTGLIMDPRLSLGGFTEEHTVRPKLDKNDPIMRQIEEQNKIVKRGTTPSKKEIAQQTRRAGLDLAFLEEAMKGKRGRGASTWLMSLLGAKTLNDRSSKGR